MRPRNFILRTTRHALRTTLFALTMLLIQTAPLHAASMTNYCVVPPYVQTNIPPNIMIILDNAYQMGNQAYTDNYDPTKTYPGLFHSDLWYSFTGNQFVPAGISYNSTTAPYHGNLLNWVTTSKIDLLESILVGGVSTSRQTNVNTLKSSGNAWTNKSYSGCNFSVDNGNITISESTADACHLLDSPPGQVASIRTNTLFARLSETENGKTTQDFLRYIADDTKIVGKNFLDFLLPPAYAAANPCGGFNISTNSLSAFTEGSNGSSAINLHGTNSGATYTWSYTGTLPIGLSLSPTTGTSTSISGTPAAGTSLSSPYSITVNVSGTDTCTDSEAYSITVNPPTTRAPQSFNVWICAGDTTQNCNTSNSCTTDSDCTSNDCASGTCALKSGIVETFYSKARFGLGDFNQVGQGSTLTTNVPTSTGCIPATPKSSFLSAIENVTPIGAGASLVSTPLVNEEYDALNYYKTNTASNCNPFAGTPACTKSFILAITSGEGADTPTTGASFFSDTTNCGSSNYKNLSKNSCYGYKNDLRSDYDGTQNVSTYIVNAMGTQKSATYTNAENLPTTTGDILYQAAIKGGGNYYEASATDPSQLRAQLIAAFQDILKRAASGTAASVLASKGQGQGANLMQAVYYPRTPTLASGNIFSTEIDWVGRLQNLWYYVDPNLGTNNTSNIFEETPAVDGYLDLSSDYIAQFYYDSAAQLTKVNRYSYSSSSTGGLGTQRTTKTLETIGNLWEAGIMLWNNLPSARTIYIPSSVTGLTTASLDAFSTDNASFLQSYLQASSSTEASRIIKYIQGYDSFCTGTTTPCTTNADCTSLGVSCDTTSYRQRTVAVDLDNDGDTTDTAVSLYGLSISESAKVWKLGDIVNSTPRISSWVQLGDYDSKYNDTTYTAFLNSTTYQNRGMVFAGANDGMLHAFKMGLLQLPGVSLNNLSCVSTWNPSSTSSLKAQLLNPSCFLDGSAALGTEMWAFIPMNALPYLKYMADPSYCHVYTVDLSPYIFDASIGGNPGDPRTSSSWRTILIGGMRFGGACKNSCSDADCVQTPVTSKGYSSYFALDVTNQNSPVLLWEFSSENLGFATTGPAVVRINAINTSTGKPDNTLNGNWFVVFGSGPTGPIDTTNNQFLAHSDQSLKLFVIPLSATPGLPSYTTINTGIGSDTTGDGAFAGSMINSTIDLDLNYSDDVVYIGYVKKASDGTWTNGGVGRLVTNESADFTTTPWVWSPVIDNIGPVTSAIASLQNTNKHILWLYFGTGRYFYEQGTTVDDPSNPRALYGIKEPCFQSSGKIDTTKCTSGSPTNVTCSSGLSGCIPSEDNANASSFNGWYINLAASGTSLYAERDITDPLATTGGNVFFTTFQPYTDQCSFGGKSYIWAVRYNTGGAPSAAQLQGVALLQESTGSIQQENLSTAFTADTGACTPPNCRKTAAIEGVPPTGQGLAVLSSPPPVKRTIHMRER